MSREITELLPILSCPRCRAEGQLIKRPAPAERATPWQAALREPQPISAELACNGCGRTYPITHDGIPIMWSDTLEQTFETIEAAVSGTAPTERDVKAANIHVYQAISEGYSEAGFHSDRDAVGRVREALRVGGASDGWHADVGCAGGNVLTAVKSAGLCQGKQVGVDVSLAGLRLISAKGFHAVLGDAECLPLATGRAKLVTCSSVLHHLFSPARFIEEGHRVLAPEGVLFTDFDPNQAPKDWSRLARTIYDMRLPAYRLLSQCTRRRPWHASKDVQTWNRVAEFHNHPGAGFAPDALHAMLQGAGFDVLLVLPHTARQATLDRTTFVRPSAFGAFGQILSLRNPFLRRNAELLLTLSRKPLSGVGSSQPAAT